jgi:stage III sporulation protein AG
MPEGLRRVLAQLKRLKYAAVVVLLGLVLLLWPESSTAETANTAEPSAQAVEDPTAALEQKLSAALATLDGAGKTTVILTLRAGTETTYAADTVTRYEDGVLTEQTVETVLSDSGSGLETPLVVQETYPVYQGALVLCQGADNAAVRLDIVSAISGLTGLGADKITVIKMED